MPQISVIVPVYKVEPYLCRCVDSVLNQTFTDFELILVDDGSPDGCPSICDEYADKDNRVHVIHQKNYGLSAARNTGIDWVFANSDSEWIYFADSDDWIHPMSLEILLKEATKLNQKIVIGGYGETDEENPIVNIEQLNSQLWNVREYFYQYNVNANVAWGKLYSRQLFLNIRYPVGKIHEDEFTTYKLLFQCDTVAVIQQPIYAYFRNPNGITKSSWSIKRLDAIEAFDERIAFFENKNDTEMRNKTIDIVLSILLRYLSQLDKEKEKINFGVVKKMYIQNYWNYRKIIPKEKRKAYSRQFLYIQFPKVLSIYSKLKNLVLK